MSPSISTPRYGFVGVGTMSSAIVRGLCTLPAPPSKVVLSPRGTAKAAALQAEFPRIIEIAKTNQDVVDQCDVCFLGVLPKQMEEVVGSLTFDKRHTIVSLASTTPMAVLHSKCAPVPPENIVRAIPLPPVAKHVGSCLMTPDHPLVYALFDALGTCVPVANEEQLRKMLPVTCLMGQFYAQQLATQRWLVEQGVEPASAAKWTGAVFHSITYDSAKPTTHTFEELVAEQTPGGLNEQVIREMTEAGAYAALDDCLDAVLARVEARPRAELTKRSYDASPVRKPAPKWMAPAVSALALAAVFVFRPRLA